MPEHKTRIPYLGILLVPDSTLAKTHALVQAKAFAKSAAPPHSILEQPGKQPYTLSKAGTVEFGDMNGYVFSASIIEFLINKYGYEKLRQLILTPEKFKIIYGVTEQEMEEKWINHLLKH